MTKEEVFDTVIAVIIEVLPEVEPQDITIDAQLINLGANSIDRMDILIMSMEELNIKVPLMKFAGVSNLEALVDTLHANL